MGMRPGLQLLVVLTAGAALAACGSGSRGPTAPAELAPLEVEAQLLGRLGASRSAEGAAVPLVHDPLLSELARRHSESMRDRGFFSHVTPDGQTLRARLEAAGVGFHRAGENVAQVRDAGDPAGHAHAVLMSSPSHRDNILSPAFEAVGVGVARQGSSYWITQIFIDR